MFKYLLKLLGIPTGKPKFKYDHSYYDSDGWYVMKPKSWKIGVKMSPDHSTIRVDMKSLREHVFGGKYEI